MPGSPRYSATATADLENVIILCPNHHLLIDTTPSTYAADRLKQMRDERYEVVARRMRLTARLAASEEGGDNSLAAALRRWEAEKDIADEEHWQEFFAAFPICLATAVQGRGYELQSKCYVGGKSWRNLGGNIVDFLALHPTNVACIEIKTPKTPLIGLKYRTNTYLPSKDLQGGWLQVLESRRSLLETAAQLNANATEAERITVTDPQCYLIIGNVGAEGLNEAQSASFELYRRSLRDLTVLTFDEIFAGVEMLLEATNPN